MIVFLRYPGTWLDHDGDDARHIQALLHQAESDLVLASLALMLFQQQRGQRDAGLDHAEWASRSEKRRVLEKEVKAELGLSDWDHARHDEVRDEVSVRMVKADAAEGKLPRAYQHQLRFLHAKSFLFALDGVRKTLLSLKQTSSSAAASDTALGILAAGVPDLAGVRDSTAHADERVQGKAKGKALPNVAIDDFGIRAPGGGTVVISGLHDDVFNCTVEDGRLAGVAVNERSLGAAYEAVQALLDGLSWKGGTRIVPDA